MLYCRRAPFFTGPETLRAVEAPPEARRSSMGNRKNHQWLTQLGMASTVGITLVVATGIGYFFGSWLDAKLGTDPYLMLLFTLLGVAAGFYEMLKLVIRLSR